MRESGYYWVRYSRDDYWEVAYYSAKFKCWHFIANDDSHTEDELLEIDERPIIREEK